MINETEKIHSIFNQIMNAHGDELTPTVEILHSGNQITINYVKYETVPYDIAKEINDALKNAGLSNKWVAVVHPVAKRRPDLGLLLEVTTQFNDGCPECCNDNAIFKVKITAPITATKKLTMCGDSLVINVTKEVKALGLNRGDFIEVTIDRV